MTMNGCTHPNDKFYIGFTSRLWSYTDEMLKNYSSQLPQGQSITLLVDAGCKTLKIFEVIFHLEAG
jgi:hypothetical protein